MKASLVVVGGNVLGAAAAFAAAIVAARVLAVDGFAAFGVGLAVNSLAVQFADFGLGTVAIAETADSLDPQAARAKMRSLLLHRIATGIAVALLVAAVVLLLPPLAPYRTEGLIAAGGEIFGSLAFFFIWCLQGERRFATAALLQSLQGFLRLALVGACAAVGLGSAPMMVAYAVLAPLATALAGGALLFASPPRPIASDFEPALPSGGIDLDRRRVMAIAGVFSAMVINGDVLLLAMLAGQHDVAAYTAAWRFSSGVLLANTAIASAFLPFVLTAPDAWAEAKHLVRRGFAVVAGWLVLVPAMAIIGPILLGTIGDDARAPLIILLVAFAIDGFYFTVYQVYLRIRRERLLMAIMILELAVMAGVTVLLRDQGASAPAYGQLAARVVACLAILTPLLLAVAKRCDWFDGPENPEGAGATG
ncbi:MAG TPA: oligosaccharide flippase family protein [Solirubrobacterales bacterium]|jgi:O-antigen/teichoic acid export membrane protein